MRDSKACFRKMFIRCLFLFMTAALLVCAQGMNAEAASPKTKAVKAYKKFLSQKTIKWDDENKVKTSKCKFGLIYIDNNSVPELFVDGSSAGVNHIMGGYKLYTYKNGKVKAVCNITDTFSYYKKTGIFVTGTFLYGEYHAYRKLSGSSEKLLLRTETLYETKYFDSKEKELTKAQFNKKLKKLVGKKKVSIPKCYKNTAKNRKKYLK